MHSMAASLDLVRDQREREREQFPVSAPLECFDRFDLWRLVDWVVPFVLWGGFFFWGVGVGVGVRGVG